MGTILRNLPGPNVPTIRLMRFDTSQHMRMSQQMRLAPRMIQSMEILQMPMLALQDRIEQELESNIALEVVEPGMDEGQLEAERAETEREDRLNEREMVVGQDSPSGSEDFERLSEMESSYGDAWSESADDGYVPRASTRNDGDRDRKMDAMANAPARGEPLVDQLLKQWSLVEVSPEVAEAGKLLIEYINDDGFLGADFETILEQHTGRDGVVITEELLGRALVELQETLEPVGVAARSAKESLLIQVRHFREMEPGRADEWADVERLINEHLEDLLQNRLPRIEQKSGISLERIEQAKSLMKRLNLTPGRDLVPTDVPPIIPDVVIEFDETRGEYIAGLTDGLLPTLRISPKYQKMSKDREVEKSTRDFVNTNIRNAEWLIESLNLRQNTLLRVVNVVLARQREFFDYGPQHLKPLPMIEVADQLGIHVGTVSRAVSDKWIQTPRGMFPLRRLFSGGTETESGRDMSWEAVKAIVQEIVDGEDKSKPLSDEAIATELSKRGITIARRTVVKYREQMGIPPARRRKVHGRG